MRIEYGGVTLDSEARRVLIEGEEVFLTKYEFNLLDILIGKPTRVFRRSELLLLIWGANYVGEDELLYQQVCTLRRKLGPCASVLRTVRGIGYAVDAAPPRGGHQRGRKYKSVPSDPRLAVLLRQSTWLSRLLQTAGGVQVTDPEVIGSSADRRVTFDYLDPNGEAIEVTMKLPLRLGGGRSTE